MAAPVTVRLAAEPEQIVALVALSVGVMVTLTVLFAVAVHELLAPITE